MSPEKSQQRKSQRPGSAAIRPWHRMMASVTGGLASYIVWRICYQVRLPLPYEAELAPALEGLWGLLLGLGPFAGIAALRTLRGSQAGGSDAGRSVQGWASRLGRSAWAYPALAGAGGLLGGLVWSLLARWSRWDTTTLAMTALWGLVYLGAILLVPLLIQRPRLAHRDVVLLPLLGALPPAAFVVVELFHVDPSPRQAVYDALIGLATRAAVVVGAFLIAPTTARSEPAYPALALHARALVDAIMEKRPELRKTGARLYIEERVPYSSAMIRKIERGARRPSAEAAAGLLAIGAAFGLDRAWGEGFLRATEHFAAPEIAAELRRVYGAARGEESEDVRR